VDIVQELLKENASLREYITHLEIRLQREKKRSKTYFDSWIDNIEFNRKLREIWEQTTND
jgi:hypothetical protein